MKMTAAHIEEQLDRSLRTVPRVTVPRTGLRPAAVLVPLLVGHGPAMVVLTRRTDDVETHKGQISFPGGMEDRSDTDPVHTALREAREELGIPPSLVRPIALLDEIATPSGFLITPVVGVLRSRPAFRLNPEEVAEVFLVPLSLFADSRRCRAEYRTLNRVRRRVWFYDIKGRTIWGATAWIARRLVERLGLL